jgi:hypothetical protein
VKKIILLYILFLPFCSPTQEEKVWKQAFTKEGIAVFNRESEGTALKEFKSEVKVTATLSSIVAAISDIDNFANWAYQTRKAELIKNEGNTQFIYVVTKAQWPVQDRDIVYECQMSQNPKTKEVTIVMIGLPNYIPKKSEIVRMPAASGLFTLTPLGENQVKITFQLKANPGGEIPLWMSNLVAADSPFVTLKNLREEIKKDHYRKAVVQGIVEY